MQKARQKKSLAKKIGLGFLILITVLIVGSGIYLKVNTYQATEKALTVSQKAKEEPGYTLYAGNKKQTTGIVFYPGALVAPESYSLWASQVAKAGYDVYVLHVPLNLAVLSPNAASKVMEQHPDEKFILAGHSLGGVMASRYAAQNSSQISGMIFLASYPDEKGSLKESGLPVLSITATNDGVLNWKTYDEAKQYLPEATEYLSIEGGNHAGFGSYGNQKGDNQATIDNGQRQEELGKAIIGWLQKAR